MFIFTTCQYFSGSCEQAIEIKFNKNLENILKKVIENWHTAWSNS